MAINPYEQSLDIKKLKGIEGYRMRVGEYRVIYEIENQKLIYLGKVLEDDKTTSEYKLVDNCNIVCFATKVS